MLLRSLCAVMLLALVAAAPSSRAKYGPPPPPTPYDACEAAIAAVPASGIPPTLLPAIARVESGRLDPVQGRVRPWPWTINVEGVGSFFQTKEEAIATVQAVQARGTRSIDVGCMQVNLMHHPTAFATLDAAFDPSANAEYAVRFLTALHAQTRDWNLAAAYYHSQTQERGEEYQRLVFGRVMTPMGPPLGPANAQAPQTVVYGAFLPSSSLYAALPAPATQFGAFAPSTPGAVVRPPNRSTVAPAASLPQRAQLKISEALPQR